MSATPFLNFSCWNNFFYDWTEESNLLQNPHCLSAETDALYLQFMLKIWALSYPRKYSNWTSSLHERHFLISSQYHYVIQINISSVETEQLCFCRVLHFTCQNLMLTSPPYNQTIACGACFLKISLCTIAWDLARNVCRPLLICVRWWNDV